jgi:hypothetical protein
MGHTAPCTHAFSARRPVSDLFRPTALPHSCSCVHPSRSTVKGKVLPPAAASSPASSAWSQGVVGFSPHARHLSPVPLHGRVPPCPTSCAWVRILSTTARQQGRETESGAGAGARVGVGWKGMGEKMGWRRRSELSGIRLYLNTAHFARFRNSRITV